MAQVAAPPRSPAPQRMWKWWFRPMPVGRIAALRTFVYGFIFLDMFVLRPWVVTHGYVPTELYRPLFIGELFQLPAPTPVIVRTVQVALLVSAAVALTGRLRRSAGIMVLLLYSEWMVIAFSYGKVDHDRFAFLVALAVLPAAGAARWGDMRKSDAAGWAVRCIQVAAVLTYFGSVFAKLRFGGIEWVTGATFMRAVLRRGTWIVDPLLDHPEILMLAQFGLFTFELLSPLMLLEGRIRKWMLIAAFTFHVVTLATIKIVFWPHLVCLLAFFPLERLDPRSALGTAFQRLRPQPT